MNEVLSRAKIMKTELRYAELMSGAVLINSWFIVELCNTAPLILLSSVVTCNSDSTHSHLKTFGIYNFHKPQVYVHELLMTWIT